MDAPLTFVLGKGGVGRSTVAAALALGYATRGAHALVVQWAVADAISPWFDRPVAGYEPAPFAPGADTMNFRANAALEDYFVGHLGMRAFYRRVIASRHVQRATRAAPGLDELMFLGLLWWITSLSRQERGWTYDRVIVDAPAMGHGASLLTIPQTAASLGFGGLLATECGRVADLIADASRSAAVVVTSLDELAVEETREFWPRIAHDLGRAPRAAIVNRSVRALGDLPADPHACAWWPAQAASALAPVYARLARRAARERELDLTPRVTIDDALLVDEAPTSRRVVDIARDALAPLWERA